MDEEDKEATPGEVNRSAPPRSVGRSILFTILIVVFFFGLLELVLAIAGVRPARSSEDPFLGFAGNFPLFVEAPQADGSILMKTAENKLDFFNDQTFPKKKGADSYRIFCMGESTTFGHPFNDGVSFCGWLRGFLRIADPTRNWEVINAGGISYASYRIVKLMEELKQYQPDLFIIYCGQNEFLEERSYGSLMALPDWALRLSGAVSHTRTYAAMKKAIGVVLPNRLQSAKERGKLTGEVDEILTHTVGPTSYHRDDLLRSRIIKHYRLSMGRMIDVAREAGAGAVLVQPAINLKDMSPFKSEHKKGLDERALHEWDDLYRRADDLQKGGRSAEALAVYRQALQIDDRYAELHYRIGQLLYQAGEFDAAEKAFWRAVDEDIAPLRILSPMREIVRELAEWRNVPLIDFPRILKEATLRQSNNAILGKEFFLDHVHTNIKGYQLLGAALLNELTREGIAKPDSSWNEAKIEALTSMVMGKLDVNFYGHSLRTLARTLNWAGQLDEAYNVLLRALEMQGPHPDTLQFLGLVSLRREKYDESERYLREALKLNPTIEFAHFIMAQLLIEQGREDEALPYFRESLRLRPYYWDVRNAFGLFLKKRGNLEEAIEQLSEAARLKPDSAKFKKDLEEALAERDGIKVGASPQKVVPAPKK